MKIIFDDLDKEQLSESVTRRLVRGERLELLVYTYAPGATFPIHKHESEQLTIVIKGKLIFTFEDKEVHLVRGEAILIPGNVPHGAYVPEGEEETQTYNVFSPIREVLPGP